MFRVSLYFVPSNSHVQPRVHVPAREICNATSLRILAVANGHVCPSVCMRAQRITKLSPGLAACVHLIQLSAGGHLQSYTIRKACRLPLTTSLTHAPAIYIGISAQITHHRYVTTYIRGPWSREPTLGSRSHTIARTRSSHQTLKKRLMKHATPQTTEARRKAIG